MCMPPPPVQTTTKAFAKSWMCAGVGVRDRENCTSCASDMEPGHLVIRVTFGDPVTRVTRFLSFFRKMFVLCFSLYSVNNRKSSVNSNTSTGRLVTTTQQHIGFLNNRSYSNFVLQSCPNPVLYRSFLIFRHSSFYFLR